jgi:ubiquinone/menaquinone biosynthesis C-methylase UbiE
MRMAPGSSLDEVAVQRAYYAATAARYDEMHGYERDEQYFALSFLVSLLDYLDVNSLLDIGAGTGRVQIELKRKVPSLRTIGIEPSAELREQGYRKGLSPAELVDGDAQALQFQGSEFDVVCEFGALHHIPNPDQAVSEMLRVARKAIFISDSNNFGQGGAFARAVKQIINAFGLWRVANFIKTKGKGYSVTEGDGVAYSYSVFNQYPQIRSACTRVHCLNTIDSGPDLYRTATHVALLGIK